MSDEVRVGQSGRLALVAKGDDCAEDVILWNFKDLAGSGRIEACHLVSGETENGGLQGEIRDGCAQVVESNAVVCTVVTEFCIGCTENQDRRRSCPTLVEADEGGEYLLIGQGVAQADNKAPRLLVVRGSRPACGLEDFAQVGGGDIAVSKGARAPAMKHGWEDAIYERRLLQAIDFNSG